jgi:hypothetical protein
MEKELKAYLDENFSKLATKEEAKSLKDEVSVLNAGMKGLEDRVVDQFHIISEGLVDQIKLLAEGHIGILERLTRIESENERQHMETRSLVKLSFAELDRRLSDLESQMKEMQEWRKRVETRFRT